MTTERANTLVLHNLAPAHTTLLRRPLVLQATVAKKYNSPNQPEGTRKEGTSVLHNVQGTPQG